MCAKARKEFIAGPYMGIDRPLSEASNAKQIALVVGEKELYSVLRWNLHQDSSSFEVLLP